MRRDVCFTAHWGSRGRRLSTETLSSFEKSAADLEVPGTGWSAAEVQLRLQKDVAAHTRSLKQQKVQTNSPEPLSPSTPPFAQLYLRGYRAF